MITTTSMSATFCQHVKEAVARAIAKANRHSNAKGVGCADVFNRKGRYSVTIRAWRGGLWEAIDSQDNDVTVAIREGLRIYHAEQQDYRYDRQRAAKPVPQFKVDAAALIAEAGQVAWWRGPEFYAPSPAFCSSGRRQPMQGGWK